MANPVDLRESFPTTENTGTGAGVPLTSVQPGSASAAVNGSVGFAFQDASGNVVLPQLDFQGRVPVSIEGQGTRSRAKGTAAGSLLSATGTVYSGFTVVLSIPITNSATGRSINDMKGSVQCRRGALFQMCYQDTVNTVILDESITDSGQYTSPIGVGAQDTFSVPASASSPAFIIRAGNYEKVSDLHSMLSVIQF